MQVVTGGDFVGGEGGVGEGTVWVEATGDGLGDGGCGD